MAEVALRFHFQPSELYAMDIHEVLYWQDIHRDLCRREVDAEKARHKR